MYKKQMKFEKIVCFVMLVAAAVVFIYSLGLMTDLYDSLYPTMMNPANHEETWVPGSIIYYDMQDFNRMLLKIGIGLILVSLLLFVVGNHTRRRYYAANYVATGLNVLAAAAATVWTLPQISAFREQYLQIDFQALQEFSEMWSSPYIESTFWFDAGLYIFIFLLIAAVLLVVNMIWKIDMMKSEKKLLEKGE